MSSTTTISKQKTKMMKSIYKSYKFYEKHNIIYAPVCYKQDLLDKSKKKRVAKDSYSMWNTLTKPLNPKEALKYCPYANGACVLTGKKNNLFVVDIDTEEGFDKYLQFIGLTRDEFFNEDKDAYAKTASVKTRRGFHLYYLYDPILDKMKSLDNFRPDIFGDKSIDIKINNQIVNAPPLQINCEDGSLWEWKWIHKINHQSLGFMPYKLKQLLQQHGEKSTQITHIDTSDKSLNSIIDKVVVKMKTIHPKSQFTNSQDNGTNVGVYFSGTAEMGKCLIAGRKHSSNNAYVLLYKDSKKAMYCCHNSDCKTKAKIDLEIKFGEKPSCEEFEQFDIYKAKYMTSKELSLGENIIILKPYICKYFSKIGGEEVLYVERKGDNYKFRTSKVMNELLCQMISYKRPRSYGEISLAKIIMNYIDIHIYDKYTFNPTKLDLGKRVMNLYTGLTLKYDKDFVIHQESVEIFCEHIRTIWCKDNEVIFQYIIRWFSRILQTKQKNGVCIVLRSNQGTGKGIVMEIMNDIIGDKYYCGIHNIEDIIGRFTNPKIQHSLLAYLDEVSYGGSRKEDNKLKLFITEKTHRLEEKFKGVVNTPSYTNCVISSNNKYTTRYEPGDRRKLILDVDNKYAGASNDGKALYFKKLHGVCRKSLFHFFMRVDLTGFNVREIPKSMGSHSQLLLSIPTPLRWLDYEIGENLLVWGGWVRKNWLYKRYLDYGKDLGKGWEVANKVWFWRCMTTKLKWVLNTKRKRSGGYRYRQVLLPTREQMMKMFRGYVGDETYGIDRWDDDDDDVVSDIDESEDE